MKPAINFLSIMMMFTFLGVGTSLQAQQKIAHVDSDAIIPEMPEYKQAKSDVEAYSKVLQKELEADQAKIQEFYADVMAQVDAQTLAPIKQKEAEDKLAKMQQDLQKKAVEADQKLAQKDTELTKPLYEKYNAALKKVAEANGYAYIIDLKLALYSGGGVNATDLVKAELGL